MLAFEMVKISKFLEIEYDERLEGDVFLLNGVIDVEYLRKLDKRRCLNHVLITVFLI